MDAETGALRRWDPDIFGWGVASARPAVHVVTVHGHNVYVGIPNPVRSSAIIRFTLPQATFVTLTVYDLQGRRVSTLLDHAVREAGRHDVPVHTDRWKPGVYLYRLETEGRASTRKMVVLGR